MDAVGGRVDAFVALIMLMGWPDEETLDAFIGPGSLFIRAFVHHYFRS